MRIGIDVRELERGKATGIGRYLLNFLNYAPKIKPDWEFILFHNQYSEINLDAPNLRKVYIPEELTIWWDQVKLSQYLKRESIDIFFSPYYKAPLFAHCPVIITIHDIIPFIKYSTNSSDIQCSPKKFALLIWSQFLANKATKIITVSQNSKKDIVKILKIPEDKIIIIPNSVEERYQPVNDKYIIGRVLRKYKINKSYILYVGNLKPSKNISGLIKEYRYLSQDLRQLYQLVIVGKKDRNFKSLAYQARSLQIENNITFIDFVQEGDLSALYSGAELFVFPSFYEGFGLPPLEAMACGTPVITSNIASLPEVVGEAGILVDPHRVDEIKAAIIKVLADSALRSDLIKRGLERSRRFTPKKAADQILKIFVEVQGAK